MGIRKIPTGAGSMTGYFYSVLNKKLIPFESLIERDYFLYLEFDRDILSYDSQPVEITKEVGNAVRKYYPDCLIIYKPESGRSSLLVEVKYSKDLENPKKADDIKRRMAVSREYAADQGWDFRLITDKDIRGPLLENYRFLYKYSDPPDALPQYRDKILDLLHSGGGRSAKDISDSLAKTFEEKAALLPCIWHLIRTYVITADLSVALTNTSKLELADV